MLQLETIGLARYFDHIQGTDEEFGMKPKPAPDVILAACKAVGANPYRCVYVGDTQRDVQAANAASLLPISVRYGELRTREEVESWNAHCVIDSISELEAILIEQQSHVPPLPKCA